MVVVKWCPSATDHVSLTGSDPPTLSHVSPTEPALPGLALSRAALDRAAHRRATPGLLKAALAEPSTRVVDLVGERMKVVVEAGPRLAFRSPAPDDAGAEAIFLGEDERGTAYLAVVRDADLGTTEGWLTLREAGLVLPDLDTGVFTAAQALANWHATHTHCPRCGAHTQAALGGWVRRCPEDASEHYPRCDPAVIMAVIDSDDRLLLGRAPSWPIGRFSVLAGFVEPGESFEAAVAREVREEVGVVVTDVTYLGNQPWPFPASLMVGFTCRAVETVLDIDPAEIAEARWFTREGYLAALASREVLTPSGISIAKRIIERWLAGSPT